MLVRKLFNRMVSTKKTSTSRPKSHLRKLRRSTFREGLDRNLQFEPLEDRRLLVIGAFAFASAVPRGDDFDGVVRLPGCTGSLMQTGTHILTAAHCVDSDGTSGTFGPDGASSARFDLVRDANNIDISLNVPVANITVHPAWGGNDNISAGNDLAIFTLTDPNDPAPDRRLVAPFGAQRYPLFTGDVTGETFTVVGYGETGTGATGQQSNEVQRVSISDPSGGTFTLTFDGETTAAIMENASAAEVADAMQTSRP